MDWYDVTPANWSIAGRHPYVFGMALATLVAATPSGVRVTGNFLSALVDGPERAAELRKVVHQAVWRSRRHQRTIERVGKLLVEVTLGMGETR